MLKAKHLLSPKHRVFVVIVVVVVVVCVCVGRWDNVTLVKKSEIFCLETD